MFAIIVVVDLLEYHLSRAVFIPKYVHKNTTLEQCSHGWVSLGKTIC